MFKIFKFFKRPKQKEYYSSFDDFIQMMLTCSDEQFKSICAWMEIMRTKDNNKS